MVLPVASSIKTVLTPGRRSPVEDDQKNRRPYLGRGAAFLLVLQRRLVLIDQRHFELQLSLTGQCAHRGAIGLCYGWMVGNSEVTAGISVNNKSPIYSSRGKIEGGSLEPSVFYPLSPQIRIANEGRHTGTATPEMWLSRCSSS
jgi:hypothetical protein